MKELPSATFRSQYAKLTEPTLITVHGHVIGLWTPVGTTGLLDLKPQEAFRVADEVSRLPGGGIQARQAQRDDLLRKINRPK